MLDTINTCFATTEYIRDLALYSHLVPATAILLLAGFVAARAINRIKGWKFAAFCSAFSLWLLSDLILWTFNNYNLIAALWAPIDLVEIVFFLLLFDFVATDLFPERRPRWLTPFILVAVLPPLGITLSGESVHGLNQAVCEMENNAFIQEYKLALEAFILLATLAAGVYRIWHERANRVEMVRVAIVASSVILFMGIFAGAEYYSSITFVYEIELYSFFTLPIFILMLTIAITSYGTFKLGDEAIKMLFYVFLILAATQFFSVEDITDFLLALMSFSVILTLGILLFRSTEREIKAKHELELANQQQESLLHFISHEIKGYLAKSEVGFAAIVEGDYGYIVPPLKTMASTALAEVRKGVATVMDILDASNLKKGTVAYAKKPFDLKKVVMEVVTDMQPAAEEKHIVIESTIGEGSFNFDGDEDKIRRHVIRNLIDNAIKYTPAGSIKVDLHDGGGKIHFAVQDSGVGITPEDMKRLFTEGGHGKDSIKINVHSTGYGLFIAKQIVEAHGGRIWAESEGQGKGSTFIIEFKAAP